MILGRCKVIDTCCIFRKLFSIVDEKNIVSEAWRVLLFWRRRWMAFCITFIDHEGASFALGGPPCVLFLFFSFTGGVFSSYFDVWLPLLLSLSHFFILLLSFLLHSSLRTSISLSLFVFSLMTSFRVWFTCVVCRMVFEDWNLECCVIVLSAASDYTPFGYPMPCLMSTSSLYFPIPTTHLLSPTSSHQPIFNLVEKAKQRSHSTYAPRHNTPMQPLHPHAPRNLLPPT